MEKSINTIERFFGLHQLCDDEGSDASLFLAEPDKEERIFYLSIGKKKEVVVLVPKRRKKIENKNKLFNNPVSSYIQLRKENIIIEWKKKVYDKCRLYCDHKGIYCKTGKKNKG
ncbi:hypothetical protein PIROE2DRAFT_4430 [Piromyces sp. E2]|nr:hypothetical protein PIROE2DRAFT_4430 [Piromyces sp. E2]|eukprot:OUM68010.1 hypothetical protein PIROE2DRAFT_4430 [Piromyces sp. E2]